MENIHKTTITKDLQNKKLRVTREFNGSVDQVWKAWTTGEILDQWWAPKPWKAKTKSMDFREGGSWLYSMVGPDGKEIWSVNNYKTIQPNVSYSGTDAFCDEKGNINSGFPVMLWKCEFKKSPEGTMVEVGITFDDEEDLKQMLEMGFEEGFTAAHRNLDALLQKK